MEKEFEALKKIGNLHSITKGCAISHTDEYKVIEQALHRLEAIEKGKNTDIIDNYMVFKNSEQAESSEALECLKHIKKDDFNMVIATYPPLPAYNGITKDEMFNKIEKALLKAEKLKVDICEMFGLDNLFPYNDTDAILKELEEYMDRRNQLWTDFIITSKKLKEQEKAWEVVKKKNVDMALIRLCKDSGEYNGEITLQDEWWHRKLLTEEEFELVKGC